MQGQAQEPEGPWTNVVEELPSVWPKVDGTPECENLQDGRVIVRWLVRASQLLKPGSNEMHKLSKPCSVELDGETSQLRLELLPIISGTGRGQSTFGASNGCGKVQIRLAKERVRPLRVRIAAGRDNRAQAWQGPQVATMRGARPYFELSGVEWNFKLAQDDDQAGKHHLAIAVELSPGSA